MAETDVKNEKKIKEELEDVLFEVFSVYSLVTLFLNVEKKK